jgi:hypothetical protein
MKVTKAIFSNSREIHSTNFYYRARNTDAFVNLSYVLVR